MKFDFIIGNPPYQEETEGTSDQQIYNFFMDETYKISDKVELITPAKFLSNAGKTSKEWNKKMLSDEHLKVLWHEINGKKVFPNAEIKGGVAITYRDATQNFGAINIYTNFDELNSTLKKVNEKNDKGSIMDAIYLQSKFNLDVLYRDYPELKHVVSSDGREKRIVSSALKKYPAFTNNKVNSDDVKFLGIIDNKRVWKYLPIKYIEKENSNLFYYKVFVPNSNGSGALGEVLSTPMIGHTQSFISIGCFETQAEAEAVLKYVKTKFARTMLGVLKVTQANPPYKWQYVPMQDFTQNSNIDWGKTVAEIDKQLYEIYGLNDDEINFIETHVKEMQ